MALVLLRDLAAIQGKQSVTEVQQGGPRAFLRWEPPIKTALLPEKVVNPKLWMERNRHGGLQALVCSGHFKDYKNIQFTFHPIRFSTHELDGFDWEMRINQRSDLSRCKVSLMDATGYGVRLRLPAGSYGSIESVFDQLEIQMGGKVVPSELALDQVHSAPPAKVVEKRVPIYQRVSFEETLREEQERIRAEIGDDWFLKRRQNRPDNVVDIRTWSDRLEDPAPRQEGRLQELLASLG